MYAAPLHPESTTDWAQTLEMGMFLRWTVSLYSGAISRPTRTRSHFSRNKWHMEKLSCKCAVFCLRVKQDLIFGLLQAHIPVDGVVRE